MQIQTVTRRASISFDADPTHLADLRNFSRRAADSLGAQVDHDLLAVVVGELAANAVVHQRGQAQLTVELLSDGALEVSVFDRSAGVPRLIDEAPWSPSGHRGIQLVAALAQDWGVDSQPDGKRVWARIATTHPSP